MKLPEKQQGPWRLADAVADMGANASDWVTSEVPGLLTDSEISVLNRLRISGM